MSVERPIFPELVTGREDQFHETQWRVRAGWALRGHASCDFVERVLEVPLGTTEVDRVIRAHELMHLRVSPHDVNPLPLYPEISKRALECAEEFRVNELLRRLGFAVSELHDGSERTSALRLCANGAWDEAVFFFVAILGTGAEAEFMKGVRKVSPSWIRPLGLLRRRVFAVIATMSNDEVASTVRALDEPQMLPRGFETVTVPIARMMTAVADSSLPVSADQLRQFRRSLEPGGRRSPTGRFAALVLDESLSYYAVSCGSSSRRPRPDVTGTSVRYPSRFLTDPQQRAFVRQRPSRGGVVVVDQSGSMDVDHAELDRLLQLTPGATVLGYSHRPGDKTGQANGWILARNGRLATTLPIGNVGNGVDGPALTWSANQRAPRDRIVWVTDGQVTDSNDHPSQQLSRECALLVRRHRVLLVRTLAEASTVLRRGPIAVLEPTSNFGRLGRELLEIQGVTG